MAKVINVFYNAQGLPFKDKELTTHFPIVGGAFQGADNTTEIRFYVDNLGANRQWAVFGKLPNGKKGFKILTESALDEDDDRYYSFMLSQFFTQYKGDIYLSLGGYYGNIVELNEEQEYELQQVSGEMTGAIKLQIAYSVQMEGSDYDDLPQWLQALASKLDTNKGIVVIPNPSATITGYQAGQLFYSKSNKTIYELVNGSLSYVINLAKFEDNVGFLVINIQGELYLTSEEMEEVEKNTCIIYNTNQNEIFYKSHYNNSPDPIYRSYRFGSFISTTSNVTEFGDQYTRLQTPYLAIYESNRKVERYYEAYNYYSRTQANTRFAVRSGDNTFTANNTFAYNPPLIMQEIGSDANPKVAVNKEYVDKLEAKSDVVDVVGTYTDLQGYDTSDLANNDVVKVLKDSEHENATTYYRWVITNNVGAWTYVGQDNVYSKEQSDTLLNGKQDKLTAGSNIDITSNVINTKNIYTETQVDTLLSGKQDKLVAGNNITIANDGKTISATDTTYTAGDGLALDNGEFSVDSSVAKKTDLNNLFKDATYNAGDGVDNSSITFKKNDNTDKQVVIPMANTTTAGLMSPSDVTAIADLNTRVSVLESIGVRLLYTASSNPTANDILNFVVASGYTDPTQYDKVQVLVEANKHLWLWYSNLNSFVDDGVQGVEQFTNSSLGTIQGSTSLGKIYAENDGTGSLFGYDKLNNNVAPQYSASNTYAVGDLVIYNGDLYKCSTAITTAETWDSTKWTQVSVGDELKDKGSLTGDNSWSGTNTFGTEILNNKVYFGSPTSTGKWVEKAGANIRIGTGYSTNLFDIGTGGIAPLTTYDLGSTAYMFTNLYLSGNISDGTNSISVADISNGVFNVINASDITNNTLTQAQYNLITNGKPTLIKGTIRSINNTILLPPYLSGTTLFGAFISSVGSSNVYPSIGQYYINSSYVFFLESAVSKNINLRSIREINGKTLPAYPTDTTKPYKLVQQVGGTLAWVEELYGKSITDSSITELTYESISVISLSANTTFTLKTPQTNCIPEYKALISNSALSDITITLTGVSKVQTNDNAITVVEGTNSTIAIPAGVELEINIFNGHCIAYNWEA